MCVTSIFTFHSRAIYEVRGEQGNLWQKAYCKQSLIPNSELLPKIFLVPEIPIVRAIIQSTQDINIDSFYDQ